jgi:hypothetical protein
MLLLCAGIAAMGWAQSRAPTRSANSLPRGPDGKPDLSGVWQALNTAAWDLQDHSGALGLPPGQSVVEGGTIPYLPEAAATQRDNFEHRDTDDPAEATCYLPGIPRATYMPFPFQIIQTPKAVVFSYEFTHARRHVFTDGSAHPMDFPDFWMGDSRGQWDGNTLVIETVNQNGRQWIDNVGNFYSENARITERIGMVDPDTLLWEARIEDPGVFTQPWTMSFPLRRNKTPGFQLMEFACHEGNKSPELQIRPAEAGSSR